MVRQAHSPEPAVGTPIWYALKPKGPAVSEVQRPCQWLSLNLQCHFPKYPSSLGFSAFVGEEMEMWKPI